MLPEAPHLRLVSNTGPSPPKDERYPPERFIAKCAPQVFNNRSST